MFVKISVDIENFQVIKSLHAEIDTKYPILIIGPNGTGKTTLMFLLYLYFFMSHSGDDVSISTKFKRTFLINNIKNSLSKVTLSIEGETGFLSIKDGKIFYQPSSMKMRPVYFSLTSVGEYYMGIYAATKYYAEWNIIPDPIRDLIGDVFLAKHKTINLSEFPILSAYVQKNRIMVQIRNTGEKLAIERVASGYKSLSWLYLILSIFPDVLLFDDIEASLHPSLLRILIEYLISHFEKDKILFISTHSDLTVEILNLLLLKKRIEKVTVLHMSHGVPVEIREATNDNLIPPYLSEEYKKVFQEKWSVSQ